jgi:hypothetical protein
MNELIERLVKEANLSPEQAGQAVTTIAAFVKENFRCWAERLTKFFLQEIRKTN